ncbi:heme-binding domain-containing protein [Flavobacterium psychrotolerans]|uniref:Cytochrome C n=1 Tax=Flavobacterium psychrotolerans TaxID=2169410 RepID=A0A2U1JIN1_9FLAO|nr:heme-binding domain-containing protein [Flavobacterium psychrotolerans]PWA05016.1 cytochrome C [Flavobacterium psychrotolerans]
MNSIIKRIAVIGLILFLLIQLYQPARNLGYEQDLTANFTKVYTVPKNVETILRTSCYDCHSNNTNYPWYSNIQPARFFMESHIKEGKENLNFNEWGNYSSRKQNNKLDRIAKQIKSNEMPLASYTLIHKNAILTPTQKVEVINWINTLKNEE